MPKLRLSYVPANKSRGAKSKRPTVGCKAYAMERRGWKNKVRRLERHIKRLDASSRKHGGLNVKMVATRDADGILIRRDYLPTNTVRGVDKVAFAALERVKKAVKGISV